MSQSTTNLTATHALTAELTESEQYELLKDEHRRLALDVLAGRTREFELAEIAQELAARMEGADPTDEESVQRLQIRLHHKHLPKMDAMGVLDYDPSSRKVKL